MKKISVVAGFLAASISASVSAGPYLELAGVMFNSDEDDVNDLYLSALTVTAGLNLNKFLAIEGFAGIGIDDQEIFQGVNVELGSLYGAALKGMIPINNSTNLYAKVMSANFELEASNGGLTLSADDNLYGFGVGADFDMDKNLYLSFSVAAWEENVTTISLSSGFRF